jgi:hypothetical protein
MVLAATISLHRVHRQLAAHASKFLAECSLSPKKEVRKCYNFRKKKKKFHDYLLTWLVPHRKKKEKLSGFWASGKLIRCPTTKRTPLGNCSHHFTITSFYPNDLLHRLTGCLPTLSTPDGWASLIFKLGGTFFYQLTSPLAVCCACMKKHSILSICSLSSAIVNSPSS